MPFLNFKSFEDCVKQNKNKKNPKGYCAVLHHKATGKWPNESYTQANIIFTKSYGRDPLNQNDWQILKSIEKNLQSDKEESINFDDNQLTVYNPIIKYKLNKYLNIQNNNYKEKILLLKNKLKVNYNETDIKN